MKLSYSLQDIRGLFENKKVVVVSYEAGAANILSALIKRADIQPCAYVLDGPAVNCFKSRLGNINIVPLNDANIIQSDVLIMGTSLVPDLERKALHLAKGLGIRSIAIIDHWVNFRERFVENKKSLAQMPKLGDEYLPNEIWVSDDDAYKIAVQDGFKPDILHRIGNYYLEEIISNFPNTALNKQRTGKTLLYICEPVFDDMQFLYADGNILGYNEYELITELLKSASRLKGTIESIILRLHPNEEWGKYDSIINSIPVNIEIEKSSYLKNQIEADCARADYVAGVESMALVIALSMHKKVFSCLPKNAKKMCSLPQREIVRIFSFDEIVPYINN